MLQYARAIAFDAIGLLLRSASKTIQSFIFHQGLEVHSAACGRRTLFRRCRAEPPPRHIDSDNILCSSLPRHEFKPGKGSAAWWGRRSFQGSRTPLPPLHNLSAGFRFKRATCLQESTCVGTLRWLLSPFASYYARPPGSFEGSSGPAMPNSVEPAEEESTPATEAPEKRRVAWRRSPLVDSTSTGAFL